MDRPINPVILVGNVGYPSPSGTDILGHYRQCLMRGFDLIRRRLSVMETEAQVRYLLDLRYEVGDLLDVLDPDRHLELLAEMEIQMRWRASVESMCGGGACAFQEFDEFGGLMLDVLTALARIYQVIEQPYIRWPRPVAPKELGLKSSTKTCRRKTRNSFFSASKSNLRNAP